MMIFKELTEQEIVEYRQYALENDPPDMNHWEIFHPICRDEWMKRGIMPVTEQEKV